MDEDQSCGDGTAIYASMVADSPGATLTGALALAEPASDPSGVVTLKEMQTLPDAEPPLATEALTWTTPDGPAAALPE